MRPSQPRCRHDSSRALPKICGTIDPWRKLKSQCDKLLTSSNHRNNLFRFDLCLVETKAASIPRAGRARPARCEFLKQGWDVFRGLGPAEQIALNLRAPLRSQYVELLLGLDALRSRRHSKAACQARHSTNDRDTVVHPIELRNERAIYFDFIEWEAAQVAER
jgi:hypothetical protein